MMMLNSNSSSIFEKGEEAEEEEVGEDEDDSNLSKFSSSSSSLMNNNNNKKKKPPLKRIKTLPTSTSTSISAPPLFSKSFTHLRVSVPSNSNNNGITATSSSSSTEQQQQQQQQQWNYPSFLGVGASSRRRRRPSPKPIPPLPIPKNTKITTATSDFSIPSAHNHNTTSNSLTSPPLSVPPPQPLRSNRSPLFFYLLIITCIIFVPHSAYLQYKLATLQNEKLRMCCEIDFCSGNGTAPLGQDENESVSYFLNADSRTIALYIVVFTLTMPFVLYKYLDYLPQIINFLRRTNNSKEDVPLKKRVAYMVDVFFSIYPYAKLLALLFATLFLIGFGGLALYAVTGGSFAEALWHSWTYVADSGNHAETEGTGQRIVSVSISSGGMLIFAMMLGLVSDAISEKVDSLRKGKCEVIERNHILILGWSDKLGSLLKQLAIANKSVGGGVIVVLAEKEKEEMEMDIAKLEFDFMGTSVICRSGSPLILADLKKVSVSKARAIIVLASDENADQSDARALRVVLSLTGVKEGLTGHVVVEMSDLDNEPLVKLVGGELIETVVAHDVIGRLMIQCALQPGLAQIWEDILGFENAEFYIKKWPEVDGLCFKEVLISFPDAIPCGVKVASDGGKIIINPDDSYVLRDGDEVLVIAEDDDTYAPAPLPEVRKGLYPRIPDPPKYPEKILFCGWRRDIDDMIMVLEAFLAPGSELWMFNEVPEKEREKKLADGGLDVFGLENIKLVHREGNAVIRRHLESLPLETFDSILILADESVEDSVAHSDSRSLATLLLIRDIQSRRLPYKDKKSTSMRLSGFSHNSWIREMQQASDKSIIISEILDSRTRNLVSVSRISDYVLSNELVSMALAMVAEDKQINRVLEELFAEEGNEMCIKPAEFYLFDQEELCFYDIMVRGRARREIVIGYRQANQERAIINPSEKSVPRKWSLDDVFVVIASGD
ncbi:hypothetical protein RIF29_41774 [Crotalaria pallida]|uniref:RCK N-terminal domain-containing protein n=1 Tax=Crotalaria pallida TaxID=3830 RepID=A0AAN9E5Q7_CROPI